MDFNSYRTNREEPLTGVLDYLYSTPPTTVARYPQKEGEKQVYYGNRPEQRNPAALMERGGTRTYLEDNVLSLIHI